jgi:hypothetical protein
MNYLFFCSPDGVVPVAVKLVPRDGYRIILLTTVVSAAWGTRLRQFFRQWFDTAYPSSGGGAHKLAITGPGLYGGGFCNIPGGTHRS